MVVSIRLRLLGVSSRHGLVSGPLFCSPCFLYGESIRLRIYFFLIIYL